MESLPSLCIKGSKTKYHKIKKEPSFYGKPFFIIFSNLAYNTASLAALATRNFTTVLAGM